MFMVFWLPTEILVIKGIILTNQKCTSLISYNEQMQVHTVNI